MEQIPTVPLDISQSNDDNCEFIIISTGLGYIKDLATIWLEFITKSLLPSIPGKFTKICIYHFDPFLELSDIAKKEAQNNIIINITQKEIALSTSTRCIYSAYTGVGFKNNYFFKGQPHIFIDIAHIFKYMHIFIYIYIFYSYLHIFAYICPYLHIFTHICTYLHRFAHIY